MRVALATYLDLPDWEVDDRPFVAALRARGAKVDTPAWDDPAVDWSRFDACLIRTTWNYMDRREEFLEWVDRVAACSRIFNPPHVVEWSTMKTYLRELEEHDLPIAPTIFLDRHQVVDVAALMGELGAAASRAFIKPMIGASARETLPFDLDDAGLAAAQAHLDRLLPVEGVLIQPFLDSVLTEGEYSVIYIDGQVTHVVRKIPVPGDYRVMDDYGASDEPATLRPDQMALATRVRETCESILECERPLLYARVDFLRDASGRFVVNEAELVEPSLFFRHGAAAAERLATALLERV